VRRPPPGVPYFSKPKKNASKASKPAKASKPTKEEKRGRDLAAFPGAQEADKQTAFQLGMDPKKMRLNRNGWIQGADAENVDRALAVWKAASSTGDTGGIVSAAGAFNNAVKRSRTATDNRIAAIDAIDAKRKKGKK
jgi:hypothetical protein